MMLKILNTFSMVQLILKTYLIFQTGNTSLKLTEEIPRAERVYVSKVFRYK